MYLGIGETQLAQIDNVTNRVIVSDNIIDAYKKKYVLGSGEVYNTMLKILEGELTNYNLYSLLRLTADDADSIIWNSIFEHLKFSVCEINYGAQRFFDVGACAELEGDEYYEEYHTMLGCGMIPESTYDFCKLFVDKSNFRKKIDEVNEYVKKVAPINCKWVAFSNDGAYEVYSNKSFDNTKDCYNDMRNAVLEKMKWNTEYDEDFSESDDAVEYKVYFMQNMIIHSSYSGVYVYKIVAENENVKIGDIFTDEFKEWLRVSNLYM